MNVTVSRKKRFGQLVRNRAFDMYMARNSLADIGEAIGVCAATVARWRDRYKWNKFLDEFESKAEEQWRKQAARLINEERPQILARQIETTRALDTHLKNKLDPDRFVDSEELQRLASAAKSSSDISSRIIGLGAKDNTTNVNVGLLVSQGGVRPVNRIESATPALLIDAGDSFKKSPF